MARRLFFAAWLFFMIGVFMRNLDSSVAIKKLFSPFDKVVLSHLGFFHRGWGMFPGPTTSTMEMRLRYDWPDQTSTYEVYFPTQALFTKSVWNEVMEDLGIRDDNNDKHSFYLKGFYKYQCQHYFLQKNSSSLLPIKITVEHASVPIHEIHTNFGRPYGALFYRERNSYDCLKNEFKKN